MNLLGFLLLWVVEWVYRAQAYIPALPTNNTQSAIDNGLNVTDISKLHLQWYSNGSYYENVSYELVGNNSQGVSQGVLVHFSEDKASPDPTTTPWIALVACDTNGTSYSLVDDIFTLARDRGAVAALLYSLYSKACIINPEYASPENFEQIFDIFSTQSLTSAHLIEYQFGQLVPHNESYVWYNSKQLNDSAEIINRTIATGVPGPGYLYATLQAYNATVGIGGTTGDSGGDSNPGQGKSGSSTNLAMIILYAITGCVSALFILVIISGAVRAIRHPERYGPRMHRNGHYDMPPQSRAQGLTRAILDTFPIVKFGSTTNMDANNSPNLGKDIEIRPLSPHQAVGTPLGEWNLVSDPNSPGPSTPADRSPRASMQDGGQTGSLGLTGMPLGLLGEHAKEASSKEVLQDSIGREICPICIFDFEDGDDLRVLPCDGKHRFHLACVDPWLLELSSSCPICRQDFQALESIISGGSEDDHQPETSQSQVPQTTPNQNRFSKYLRFAKRRRDQQENTPTPPVPHAFESDPQR